MIVLGLIGLGVVVLLVINASPLPVVISALARGDQLPLADRPVLLARPLRARAGALPAGRPGLGRHRRRC